MGDLLKNYLKVVEREETMQEASYSMNIGFEEMVNFYQKATNSEIKKMEKIIKDENWNAFKKMIKKVLGTDLQ